MDGEESESFGTLLRRHRVRAGLSQESLAERARMSARGISDLERGIRQRPYRDTVAQLASALELDAAEHSVLEQAAARVRVVRSPRARPRHGSQGDTLLGTKLAVPAARASLVARPHLLERLQAGFKGPLTLLTAPAGSGKTTLLSAWRASLGRDIPLAWVSLDVGDNAPAQFWRYVLAALDTVSPGVSANALDLLKSPEAVPIEAVLTQLVNSLNASDEDLVLVLDDYHLIEATPIHRALTFLLDHLPPSLHLVIATRADPPLRLSHLRARGHVTEIRAKDLRFTVEEAASFLTKVMGLQLTADEIGALEGRTEGWIAGLQLAALSLLGRSPDETAAFVTAFTGSHRHVADYLGEEVLARQPDDVQRFLLRTSILDRMCAPLCAAVIGDDGEQQDNIARCQARLEQLERSNLFVAALDERRGWYRYHHLFAELLRHRQQQCEPTIAPELHRRASAWFEEAALLHDAIDHALGAGGMERAAALTELVIATLIDQGATDTLRNWLTALPDAVMRRHPRLCATLGWLSLEEWWKNTGQAEAWLDVAEQSMREGAQTDDEENLRGVIATARSFAATVRGDVEGAVVHGEEALTHLSPDNLFVQSLAGLSLGRGYMARGDLARAARVFEAAAVAGRAAGKSPAVQAMASQSCAQRGLGKLHLAAATCREAIAWIATVKNPHTLYPLGMVYAALADVQREWNDLDLAMRHAMEGLRLWPPLTTYPTMQVLPRLVLARIKQALGDLAGAFATVRQAEELAQTFEAADYLAILRAFEAQLWLMQGQLAPAIAWAERVERETDPQPGRLDAFRFLYRCEHLAIAPIQILIARGRAAGDSAYLRAALDQLQQGQDPTWADVPWLRIKSLILEALARQALGELTPALVAIEQALALAEPEGYIRVFADEGPPVGELLRQVRTHGSGTEHVGAILAVLERHGLRDIAKSTQPGSEYFGLPLAKPLSAREFEVLRLLAVGQSNPEIARTLYVEVTTVKTHIRNLYGKLGVHNRVEAVQRARELTLL